MNISNLDKTKEWFEVLQTTERSQTAMMTLKAGEVLFIPAGTIHAAKNVGSVNAAELGTYVVEKGKPLVTLVK